MTFGGRNRWLFWSVGKWTIRLLIALCLCVVYLDARTRTKLSDFSHAQHFYVIFSVEMKVDKSALTWNLTAFATIRIKQRKKKRCDQFIHRMVDFWFRVCDILCVTWSILFFGLFETKQNNITKIGRLYLIYQKVMKRSRIHKHRNFH